MNTRQILKNRFKRIYDSKPKLYIDDKIKWILLEDLIFFPLTDEKPNHKSDN